MPQLIAPAICLIILAYAFLMTLFKITKFEPNTKWPGALIDIFKTGLPVAMFEEFVFRYVIMYWIMIMWLGIPTQLAIVYSALFFSLTHFIWGMYRSGSEHQTISELACLVVGLTLFGMVTGKLFFTPYANILWHGFAIYGVQLTSALFKDEGSENWWIWDDGHQLVRTIPMWIVMIGWYISWIF